MAVKQFKPGLLSLSVKASRWRFSENADKDGGRSGTEFGVMRCLAGLNVSWNILAAIGASSIDGPGVFSKDMATRATCPSEKSIYMSDRVVRQDTGIYE